MKNKIAYFIGLNDKLNPAVVERLKMLIQPYTKVTFDEVQHNGEDALCKSNEIINVMKSEGLI